MPFISKTKRECGIELLKLFAIFLIVLSHVTQTLGQSNDLIEFKDYVVSMERSTKDIQVVFLMLIRQAGALGNTIFLVCSAWFLVSKQKYARKKSFLLLCTTWSISVLFLLVYLTFCPSVLTFTDIIRQFFPVCFANNWYISCYIVFLFVYPLINKLIEHIEKKEHLRIVFFCRFFGLFWIMLRGDGFYHQT